MYLQKSFDHMFIQSVHKKIQMPNEKKVYVTSVTRKLLILFLISNKVLIVQLAILNHYMYFIFSIRDLVKCVFAKVI